MRIGIDFDDVVADSIQAIVNIHNATHGTKFNREDAFTYRAEEVWGGTKEEWRTKLDEFFSTKHLAQLAPIAGSLVAIDTLKKHGHELFIVTGRGKGDVAATEQWLKIHFPDVFRGVHYGDFVVRGNLEPAKMKKSDICKENGIALLIDDNPDVAKECGACGVNVFLFDQPWNRSLPPTAGITRVFSWEEIVEKLNLYY